MLWKTCGHDRWREFNVANEINVLPVFHLSQTQNVSYVEVTFGKMPDMLVVIYIELIVTLH